MTEQTTTSAYGDLLAFLEEGEQVEGVCFGPYGWDSAPSEGESWKRYSWEPDPPPVPFGARGKLLSLADAEAFMEGWVFAGGYGVPECYATYIWTDQRVIWVTQYDGSTWLTAMPRNPIDCMPEMPGGG